MVLGLNQIWGLFCPASWCLFSMVTLASYHSLKTEVRLTTDSTLTVRVERVYHLGLPCCSRPQSLSILCLRLIPELACAFFQSSFLQPLVRFLSVSPVCCLLAVHAMQRPDDFSSCSSSFLSFWCLRHSLGTWSVVAIFPIYHASVVSSNFSHIYSNKSQKQFP